MTAAETVTDQEARVFDPEAYILLVPFGGQLEPKINREYMANGVLVRRAVIDPEGDIDITDLDLSKARGVVLSGGNDSVYAEGARRVPQAILDLKIPKLGICYGKQAMVHQLGGRVVASEQGEHGAMNITIQPNALFDDIEGGYIRALLNHQDIVVGLPDGYRSIAESPAGIAGATNDKDVYLVQFHPESSQTPQGTKILLNFATKICGLLPEPNFTEEKYRQRVFEQEGKRIQHQLGSPAVRTVVLNSGGVDSAVAHAQVLKKITEIGREHTVSGLYVDCGLMRHEDGDTIAILNEQGYRIETEDWSDFFLHQQVPLPPAVAKERGYSHLPTMDQVTDPGIMRQIVKYGFMEVLRRVGLPLHEKYPDAQIIALVQGTNLADKIESGDFDGDQIKEHHNSGIEKYVDLLIEPNASLFKGDIRKLAEDLGLPPEIIFRQPFPGPGLCLRLPANATGETQWPANIDEQRLKLEKVCGSVGHGALAGCWLPFKATGQKGDVRVRSNVTLLSGNYDPELIQKLAMDIPAQTNASRVLYTSHEVDPEAVTSIRQMIEEVSLNPLRDVEEIKSWAVVDSGLGNELSQHYVASLPVSLDGSGLSTLMTRMFRTGVSSGLEDYIDGEAALGGLNVHEGRFHAVLGAVAAATAPLGYSRTTTYDATSKPPGTVELA